MSRPLRVLHVAQPTTEGVAVLTAAMAADQVTRGWDVAVACPGTGDLPVWTSAGGAQHLPWAAARNPGASVPREVAALRGLIGRFGPDVVHLQSSKAGLAGRLAIRGRIATVFSPHAWSFLASAGPQAWAALRWERWATRWTAAVVAVSAAEASAGQAAGIEARYVVARNGVDLQLHPAADAADRRAARSSLALGPEPLAVCVGRVCRQKGQDLLLAAWPTVRSALPDALCVLVGDGPDLAAVQSSHVAGVRAVGRRDDVPSWLAAADVVVLPSRWEGLSLAMLEAMAAGRALVVSDVSGATEALGEVSAAVPVGDVPALADAVTQLLADPQRAAAEGAALRRRAEELFDLRRTADELAAVYLELSGRR
ncbi:MAG: hypothetical protein QOE64_1409 [Frankiales bacterium]|nr:hypothetical protein [Frankiales bacterium]